MSQKIPPVSQNSNGTKHPNVNTNQHETLEKKNLYKLCTYIIFHFPQENTQVLLLFANKSQVTKSHKRIRKKKKKRNAAQRLNAYTRLPTNKSKCTRLLACFFCLRSTFVSLFNFLKTNFKMTAALT